MNPRVGKQRRGSWTEKVARFFDGWRLKNYGDFKCLSPSKISVKKISQNWGNPYSETPKFGSSTIKQVVANFSPGLLRRKRGSPFLFSFIKRKPASTGRRLPGRKRQNIRFSSLSP